MRVLLDEGISHRFRRELPGHDVLSVQYMGWRGEKNGRLLSLANSQSFDVFLTSDRTLADEQELVRFPGLSIVVLKTDDTGVSTLRPFVPRILQALTEMRPGKNVTVDCSRC